MSIYMTEAEQLDAIKKWWKRYSNVVTVVLSLILLAVSGYKYWNWHQDKVNQQASNAYEHLMLAFSNQDNKGIRSYANQLLKDYDQTIYADAARLTLAKLYAVRDKYAQALEELNYVATHSKMGTMQQVAKIRMARLFLAEKEYDKALSKLSQVESSAYVPVVNELRGDIFAAMGDYQQAIASYKKAISQVQTQGMGNLFLEMKTNELAAMTQSKMINEEHQKAA